MAREKKRSESKNRKREQEARVDGGSLMQELNAKAETIGGDDR